MTILFSLIDVSPWECMCWRDNYRYLTSCVSSIITTVCRIMYSSMIRWNHRPRSARYCWAGHRNEYERQVITHSLWWHCHVVMFPTPFPSTHIIFFTVNNCQLLYHFNFTEAKTVILLTMIDLQEKNLFLIYAQSLSSVWQAYYYRNY